LDQAQAEGSAFHLIHHLFLCGIKSVGLPAESTIATTMSIQLDLPPELSGGGGRSTGSGRPSYDDDQSVATTVLASEVGSTMLRTKDAFLRSITLYKEEEGEPPKEWGLVLKDGDAPKRRLQKRQQRNIQIESISGYIGLSQFKVGDHVTRINGRKLGPSYNAERAMDLMRGAYEEDKFLYVAVGNEGGADSLVHATIIKPHPDMKYSEMGMTVWFWGVLCIKAIDENSIFYNSILKETDHIISVNDINCDKMKPEAFAHCLDELPLEINIVVRRGKQRWYGGFN